MTPADYANEIVVPTLVEFLKSGGNRRLAYLSAISTYHLVDYLHVATSSSQKDICKHMRSVCSDKFDVVQGICNGTKHAGDLDRTTYKFQPGTDEHVPAFGFAEGRGSSFGQGIFGISGIRVEHNGKKYFLEDAILVTLQAFCSEYPQHLGSVDLSQLPV